LATYEDGHTVGEEHLIDEPEHDGRIKIVDVYLKPAATPNPEALTAIGSADMVVIGPGDLYTSILPNLLVSGVPEALKKTKAKIVYVMNLMTKYGQTYNFTAQDHIRTLERILGKTVDTVLINTKPLAPKALAIYAKYHEIPVKNDLPESSYYRVVKAPLISSTLYAKSSSDALIRSLIRHNSEKLASALFDIMERSIS
jgi:uncharacterized cofD-like protein